MKNSVEQVFHGKKIIASIVHLGGITGKASFFTSPRETIQAGILNKMKGALVRPHFHAPPSLKKHNVEEVILILKGRARVNFYTKKGEFIAARVIKSNDLLIQKEMGHSFEILKDTSLLEIKPGPYLYAKTEIKTLKKNPGQQRRHQSS